MTKLGVKVRLGKEATPALIEEMKPDVLILAAGGVAAPPEIPGILGKNVVSNAELHRMLKFFLRFLGPATLRRLTKIWMPLGKRVVIIGGGIQGCELAEFLVKRGRKVTIVESADALGEGMISHLKLQLFWWFREKGVAMMTGVKPVAITAKGVTVLKNRATGRPSKRTASSLPCPSSRTKSSFRPRRKGPRDLCHRGLRRSRVDRRCHRGWMENLQVDIERRSSRNTLKLLIQ